MAWCWMILAILFEVAGTTCLKLSYGLSKLVPSILAFIFYFACFGSLAIALKRLEVGIAYAIWAGLGTALIALIGVVHLGESTSAVKIISLILIIAGVMGLHLAE